MQTLTDQQEINKFMQSKQTLNDRKDSIMFTPANLIWELQVLIFTNFYIKLAYLIFKGMKEWCKISPPSHKNNL